MIARGTVGLPDWGDRPVALVGAGPSLTGFDFERLRGPWRVVAINQKWLDLPWADAVVSVDLKWITDIAPDVVRAGLPVYLAGPDNDRYQGVPGAVELKRRRSTALSDNPGALEMGCTSGYAGLNFVYLKRPPLVVLFGYDYTSGKLDHDKPDQYPWHPDGHNARYWPRWATEFTSAVPQLITAGMRVINASPRSSITCFPRCTVDDGVFQLERFARAEGERLWPQPEASVTS